MSPELPLSTAFVVCVPTATAGPALERVLGALHRAGEVAWPQVTLAATDFVSHLAERIAAESAEGSAPAGGFDPEALPRLNGRDLFLACACARGVPEAIGAFEKEYLSQIAAIARRFDPSPAFGDELCQHLRVSLLCGTAERRPRTSEYAGRGTLLAWLRVSAVRAALNLQRRHPGDANHADTAAMVVALADPALDPELDLIKGRYRAEFKEALERALQGLTSEQRNLLRLQVLSGLSSEQIATLYRVNRSTVSRWLSAAREAVFEATRAALHQHLPLSPSEFASLAGEMQSQLDLSLTRILHETPAGD